VDDEPSTRRVACGILSDLGYRVLEAGSADAAIGVLESESWVDLLFTDVVMPGAMNGLELGRWALRHRPEVKVLLTSGFPQPTSGKEAAEGDNLPFLKKPYSTDKLQAAVESLLRAEGS
jgi:CheY-like chemotaxis protein